MLISLDSNVWIFGILEQDISCAKILLNLQLFSVLISEQIRAELERNLSNDTMRGFYRLVQKYDTVHFDFALVPDKIIKAYNGKGLKKGDTEIAAFCEWRNVRIIVSDNRDFLSLIAENLPFDIMSPKAFCKKFDL